MIGPVARVPYPARMLCAGCGRLLLFTGTGRCPPCQAVAQSLGAR